MIESARSDSLNPSCTAPSARESDPASKYVVPDVSAFPDSASTRPRFEFASHSRKAPHASSTTSTMPTTRMAVRKGRLLLRGFAGAAGPEGPPSRGPRGPPGLGASWPGA